MKKIKKLLCKISCEFTTKLLFFHNFHKRLNLKEPMDFNEKLQYLKLKVYSDNPVVTQCVDKYRVRDYLEQRGYSWLLPEFFGGPYENPEDIRKDWQGFPTKFAIKCNHGCKYNILVRDKESVDLENVIQQLKIWMGNDFWTEYCEPQYKNVPKRVIVEEYLGDDIASNAFFCFHGEPKFMYHSTNGDVECMDFYDMEWNHLPIKEKNYPNQGPIEKLKNFDQMVEIAKDLSKDFPFVRVDFYNVDGKINFSELTFVPFGGNMKIEPKSIIEEWGALLNLSSDEG